ncbi:hypothetical protein AGMMS50212_09950 [Spirochaetia bacterium]|nr:hypothetical protein AGMMS50212_09950 [Spirochaetia bacterium]
MVIKKVLIIIDGDETVLKLAAAIAQVMPQGAARIVNADDFQGQDILQPDFIFLGCADTAPFKYVENVFKHINLVDRHCAVFSPSSNEAVKWLIGMAADSEIKLADNGLVCGDAEKIKLWVQDIIKKL